MRKRFKIKNLIRNNRYTFLSRGEERNLLPNAVRLKISGGGWTSPLLYSWGSLKKYGARLMCASNELTPTRISKFASSLRNSALPLGEGQTKSGGHSPLLYTGHSQKRNGHRHVMLNLFQHLATVELHRYSKRLPQRRNIGQTLNQVQGDMKMLDCIPAKVQRRPLYIPSPQGARVEILVSRGEEYVTVPLYFSGYPVY